MTPFEVIVDQEPRTAFYFGLRPGDDKKVVVDRYNLAQVQGMVMEQIRVREELRNEIMSNWRPFRKRSATSAR